MMNRFTCALILLFSVSCTFSVNRALVVGIGKYNTQQTGWSEIHGDSDVDMLQKALLAQGFKQKHILTLTNQYATKKNILKYLENLAADCQVGDKVFFLFSGHGQPVVNLRSDEADGYDESIVPYDAYRTGRFIHNGKPYNGQNHLIDNEFNEYLNKIKVKIGKKGIMFVAIDACFSQGIEQDSETEFDAEDLDIMGPSRGTADIFRPKDLTYLQSIKWPKDLSKGGKLIIVSACRSNERNFEYKIPGTNQIVGSLSHCIALLLKTDCDFKRWENYFMEKRYKGQKLFITSQHPTITVY